MLCLLSSSGMMISKRGGRRLVAQAFSTTIVHNNINSRLQQHQHLAPSFSYSALAASSTSTTPTSRGSSKSRSFRSPRPFSTKTRKPPAQRRRPFSTSTTDRSDEDLDSALNDILGDLMRDSDRSPHERRATPAAGIKTENSRPDPQTLQKDAGDTVDWTDREQLATSHPRWRELGVPQAVLDALAEKGITHFTPVQAQAMAPILARRDIIGRSRTGTGKTLAFGIPSMMRIMQRSIERKTRDPVSNIMKYGRLPSMLILCPTRELARQVQEELAHIAKQPPLNLETFVFHGGVSYDPQARALQQGVDVIVGTPGRIMDHLDRRNLDLSECDIVVLDEADEMLTMGFAEDVEVGLCFLARSSPRACRRSCR